MICFSRMISLRRERSVGGEIVLRRVVKERFL